MRPLLFLSLSLLAVDLLAAGKELAGERAAATSICPSPEEARAAMSVPEGYEVRCFAHEPMVQNPVAMTWDHRGRLWIVEAYEYPEGTPLPVGQRPFGREAKDDRYHPMPRLGDKLPRDRVIILEDTDNDGEADKRTVFVEGLNLASAIICGDDGIYVGQQPHLIHFRDDDSDDKPDAWRVVLTGFGREDTHELVNSFTWGPDGWLYMTHGVFTNSKVRRPGQPESAGFKFDAGIGRARATTREKEGAWEFEVFADGTSNPWGCDYDAAGNFFVSACVIDHFFHMAPGGIYVRQGGAPENPYSYELLPSIVKHKHFRAAYAGIQIYQGGRYPADTHGHAFIGNIHDNAIHEEVLTPVGASFKCEPRRDFLRANNGWFRPVSTQTGPDGFLWIMDWCDKYPCYQNAKANPEGVDRVRGRIWRVVHDGAHASRVLNSASSRSSVPAATDKPAGERQGTASGGEAASSTRGRVRSIPSRERADLDLKKLATPELVKTLEDSNNWMRRMARRMLVERRDESSKQATETVLHSARHSSIILEALWTLHQAGHLDAQIMDRLTNHAGPAVRSWIARLSGERFHFADLNVAAVSDKDILSTSEAEKKAIESLRPELKRLRSLDDDKEIMVRSAVATALRQASSAALTTNRSLASEGTHWRMLARTYYQIDGLMKASADSDDRLLTFQIWMIMVRGLENDAEETLNTFLAIAPESQPLSRILTQKAMRRLCDTHEPKKLDLAVNFCDKMAGHDVLLAHALDGLVKGQEGGVIKPTKNVSATLAMWRTHSNADVRKHAQTLAVLWGDEAAIREMIVVLHNAKKPEKERIAVLQSLRQVKTDVVKEGLTPLLTPETSTALAVAAMRAAADLGGDEFIEPLLKLAQDSGVSSAPQARGLRYSAAIEALSSRKTWTVAMLDAIAAGKVRASGFPVPVRRALATSKDKGIRDRAFKVLGAWQDSSADVRSLIAQKRQVCLTGEPDLANGKLIFTTTCMVCHAFYGGGQKVGPDLIGSGRSNLDAILANVIDPNQIIGNGYENFTVSTKDGRTLAGRVVEDTPGYVKLLGAGGVSQVVPRDQVAGMTNTKQSLMPMGFGNLPDAAFRDLVWYVLAPPEEGPLTQEKKELLIKGVEVTGAAKPKGSNSRAIDWKSVSLWNPAWQVSAPDFERTPVKIGEYYGRRNVLLMHPFPDKKTPASLERKFKVEAGKTKLKATVAADDRGDWTFKAVVNGQVVKEMTVDHEKPRWRTVEIDLAKFAGQEVTVRLEVHASGWSMEFAYWGGIVLE